MGNEAEGLKPKAEVNAEQEARKRLDEAPRKWPDGSMNQFL
jgi:hypothetical protein